MKRKDKNIIGRARTINAAGRGSGPVVYWMDREQRLEDNWALLFAQQEALIREKPLHIVFCLPGDIGSWTGQKRNFLIHGLQEIATDSPRLAIGFTLLSVETEDTLLRFMLAIDPHIVVTDCNPLRTKKKCVSHISSSLPALTIVEVDSHNIIPVWVASAKREYGAYTIRPKIHRLLPDYLTDFPPLEKHPVSPIESINTTLPIHDPHFLRINAPLPLNPGGKAARQLLHSFLANGLPRYHTDRNNPLLDGQSGLSPYFHFGHLSPQRAALAAHHSEVDPSAKEAFLEELIVRRELADNFCFYEENYDSLTSFPSWAQTSLDKHRGDAREYCYELDALENGETHEALWNSCQRDLVITGKLHGYLRMYWAKKILEWTASPEAAIDYSIYLNDTYSLDGRDPNGYAGIAWSLGGVHDRAWPERQIFGKIRYMNERGCRRKFNVDEYITTVSGISKNSSPVK